MLENLFNEINTSFSSEELIELLDYEFHINEKKINEEELSEDEYFFDTYFIKPSTICKILLERSKK